MSLELTTNQDRLEVADIIKHNLEEIGIKVSIRILRNSYYKNNLQELNYEILLTGNTVSIKPNVQEYLNYKNKPNFIGLYFDSIILLYSNDLKGNFECNWYNIFYNVDTWHKIIE